MSEKNRSYWFRTSNRRWVDLAKKGMETEVRVLRDISGEAGEAGEGRGIESAPDLIQSTHQSA